MSPAPVMHRQPGTVAFEYGGPTNGCIRTSTDFTIQAGDVLYELDGAGTLLHGSLHRSSLARSGLERLPQEPLRGVRRHSGKGRKACHVDRPDSR